jgi:plastocyanin
VGNGTVGGNATVSGSSTNTSTGAPSIPQSAEVSIEDNEFVNATVTIAVGGTVTWMHNGSNPHTVTDDGGAFDSSPNCGSNPLPFVSDCLEAGDDYSATYDEAGSFPYHCKVHDGMTGTVQVVEA